MTVPKHITDPAVARAYRAWSQMKTRCNNPNFIEAHRYSMRGIGYVDTWETFAGFLADMGPCPPGKRFGVSRHTIRHIRQGRKWANV